MGVTTIRRFSWFWMVMSCLIWSCQDPISIGSDLLDDEKINIGYLESSDLTSQTILGDNVPTFTPNVDSRTYLLGNLDDDQFGKSTAEIYLNCYYSTKPSYLADVDPRFDSLVLLLQYDTLGTFGQTTGKQKVEVFQLDSEYSTLDTFYSNTDLSFKPNPLFSGELEFRPKDSVTVTNIGDITTTVKQLPHLRLKLDNAFGEALLKNVDAATNDTLFRDFFKGLYIKSTPVGANSIFGFNFLKANLTSSNPANKIVMYYTAKNDSGRDTIRTFNYLFSKGMINRFVHDPSGSKLGETLTNPTLGNELTYLQPMGGVKTVVTFENLDQFKDKLINKAELDLFVYESPDQTNYYPIPNQLLAGFINSDGKYEFIPEIKQLVDNQVSDFGVYFGGTPNTTGTIKKYTLNVTNYLRDIISKKITNNEMQIRVITESETPKRVVFYGAKHPNYPMKLKVTFTEN